MFDQEGFLPDQPGPDDESRYACPHIVHNPLHLPWEPGFPDGGRSIVHFDTLQRPSFFRTQSMPTGINTAARHVVGEESTACPYCRERFRNPNALKLHVEQSHAAEFEWLFEHRVERTLEQKIQQLEQWDANEATPAEQARMDKRIDKETCKMREKFLNDLVSGAFDYTDFL